MSLWDWFGDWDGAMTRNDLLALWPRLSPSAQKVLLQQVKLLVDKHSGIIELHCHKGGVRLLRVGQDYKPEDDGK